MCYEVGVDPHHARKFPATVWRSPYHPCVQWPRKTRRLELLERETSTNTVPSLHSLQARHEEMNNQMQQIEVLRKLFHNSLYLPQFTTFVSSIAVSSPRFDVDILRHMYLIYSILILELLLITDFS